jgi:hypothetical protein
MQLARHNRVQLIWVPGHEDIVGNETTDLLTRTGSVHRTWTSSRPFSWSCQERGQGLDEQESQKQWESQTGLKQAKGLISGPSARRTKDLLELNRDQLRWVVGVLTGHCYLKGHLFKTGIDRWSNFWQVPTRRRISHTYPVWLWGHSLFKISSPGPVLYGTKPLLWRSHK